MPWTYVALGIAIAAEVVATSALKASASFTRPVPSVVSVLGYAIAFWLLAVAMRTLPVGVVYAIWSGMGIVLIAVIGRVVFRQSLDWPAVIGMSLILAGVLVVNLFSKSLAP